jgi:catechol 2,3-dioxygenase-like lactoylglutathione lyase family enzyme
MRTLTVAICLASALAISPAAAQYAPFNETGVTMGHWHLVSQDVEANKKIFIAMGGQDVSRPGSATVQFPGARVNLNLGDEPPGKGGTVGSLVNHVGFIVKNVQEQTAKWKAAGVPVLPGGNNRQDQAFVVTPDGVRIEILEDKTQAEPIKHEHVHFFLPEAEIPKAVAWYAKTFGGKAGTRGNQQVVDIPGGQFRFAKADKPQERTRGRVLDHFGVDVKDHAAFVKKIEAEGVKLEERPRKNETTGTTIVYINDLWGARIEVVQRGK